MNSSDQAIEYAKDVLSGKIVSCLYIKQACQRFLDDLEVYEYRAAEVNKCLKFMNCLKHYKGGSSGKRFILLPFQVFLIANIVGLYKDGRRKYTLSYILMARKNGKSFWAAALCLYFLLLDGEASAEVLLLANSREQAKTVDFATVSTLALQLDPKGKTIKRFRDYLNVPKTISTLKVLAAEAMSGDGYNCSFGLIDEFHESPDLKMKDLVVSSQGMRENPHCCIITTAGFDVTKPCYRLRSYCLEVLAGIKQDDSLFAAIYELDEGDDYTDEVNWPKSNPALGSAVRLDFIREQVNKARNNPSDEVSVKTKTLNIWCQSADTWLTENIINKSTDKVNLEDFKGLYCHIGIDLSSVSDLSSMSVMIPYNLKYYYKTFYYLPQAAITESALKETYKLWHRLGLITLTPGNVTDYDYITNDIMRISKVLNILGIHYDSWNSTQWAIDATALGLPLEPFGQSIGNFNKPTKELERLVLSGKVIIDDNEITRFCFRNVQLKYDHNNNCKPVKGRQENKIDGVITMIEALGGYLQTPTYSGEIFVL